MIYFFLVPDLIDLANPVQASKCNGQPLSPSGKQILFRVWIIILCCEFICNLKTDSFSFLGFSDVSDDELIKAAENIEVKKVKNIKNWTSARPTVIYSALQVVDQKYLIYVFRHSGQNVYYWILLGKLYYRVCTNV